MAYVDIFHDSFDNYTDLNQKWTTPGAGAVISGAGARTGTQCLALAGVGGPQKSVGVNHNWISGHAYKPPQLGGNIMIFYNTTQAEERITALVLSDGSLELTSTNAHIPLGATAGGLLSVGNYAYIEYAIYFGATTVLWVRVNGIAVAPYNPLILGAPTPGFDLCDLWVFTGPGGLGGGVHDDVYFGYSTTPATIQNDFQGAVKIYPMIAVANETPQDWTPLTPPAFTEVSQIPPPGDTHYISDGTVGHVSQFQVDFIPGQGPSGSYTIPFAQTVMSAKIDGAGTRLIAPNIGGHTGTSIALGSDYTMTTQPYLINPVTGVPFVPADFATTFFGPEVTG